MAKLKGFISYAHADEDYFILIKDGLRKHGIHSQLIDSDLWTDEKILAGSLWHESIQQQVAGCDFAVFLVSSNFLASEYIAEHEFKNFLKRQDEEGFLFFPLLVNACDFSYWERLAARQFFMPKGKDYGRPELNEYLTFGDLVIQFPNRGEGSQPRPGALPDGRPEKIEAALTDYQKKKAVRQSLPTSKYFHIRHISEIQPKDILETRSLPSQGFRDYYLDRPYLDDRLAYNYEKRRHTIVTGKPLAGKTRSVYELVNGLKNKDVLLFFPELKDIDMGDFRIPDTGSEVIVLFDDFERFLHLENLDRALRRLMLQENLWIVGTCRKDRLQEAKNTLDDELSNFDLLEVLLLDAKEDTALKRDMPDRPNQKSDGTPGGYCLPMDTMRKHFNSFPEDSLEREILHACKALRHWQKMEFDASFQKEKIRDYCLKRLEYYYQTMRPVSPAEWDRALQNLSRKELIVDLGETIAVEEIYLDEFVAAQNATLTAEMLQYFPTIVNFTKSSEQAPDYEQAEGVLERMKKEGVRPNEVTFSSLLNKAPDYERAEGVLERMKKEGVRPNEVTFSSLLNKAPDYERAEGVLERMKKEGVRPDEVTFSSLLNKAPDYERAEGVLERMKKEGVRPDEVTFSSLLNKAPDYERAEGVLERMKKEGVRPDEVTFNSLLNKAPDYEQAEGFWSA
ncbi:MAG: TIR domain-containing protein [Lewinellaceae bacterium]|nr:TIR domain-containing protein [Lewinellaceae bacterium]